MLTHRSSIQFCILSGLLFLRSPGGLQLPAQTPIQPQTDSSKSLQRPAHRQVAPAASRAPARELVPPHCMKRHKADRAGTKALGHRPRIPTLSDVSWEVRRSRAQLRASILDGRREGDTARPWHVSEEREHDLVSSARAFVSAAPKSGQGKQRGSAPAQYVAATGLFFRRTLS
jgi:hypothetical protein